MLTSEDYRQMADRSAQLAIACPASCVAAALLALSLDYMMAASRLSEHERPQMRQHDTAAGFGD